MLAANVSVSDSKLVCLLLVIVVIHSNYNQHVFLIYATVIARVVTTFKPCMVI